jgi:hypothetical protein
MAETVKQDWPNTVIQGDRIKYTFNFWSDRDETVEKDITGWTLWFTVKENVDDSDGEALIQEEITGHTDAANGKTELVVNGGVTETVKAGDHYFDVQIDDGSGDGPETIWKGTIPFEEGVTDQ